MYKISVVIPVYNAESTIEKCVASVLCQSIDALELVLVDDGSTDSSPAIIDRMTKENRNIIVIHQANSKQGAARNAGMGVASGEYIMFLDADDYMRGDSLNAMYETARAKDLDMLASSIISVNAVGREFETAPLICDDDILTSGIGYIKSFGYKIQPTVVAYLFRKSFLDHRALRFEEHIYSEDCLFVLQCATKAKRMLQHRYAHYVYQYNEHSTTRRINPKLCLDNIDISLKIVEYTNSLIADSTSINAGVKSQLLGYAAYVAHASLTKATEQNLPASEVLRGEARKKLLSVLKYDKKYYPAIFFIYLRGENLYQRFFLGKLIKLKRKLSPR